MDRCSTRLIGAVLSGAVCATAVAGDAAAPRWLSSAADAPLRATVTLLLKQGEVGRETAIFTGYAPQLAFRPGTAEVTCRFDLGDTGLEPGATRTVGIDCFEALKVREDALAFTVLQGGRKVGTGVLLR